MLHFMHRKPVFSDTRISVVERINRECVSRLINKNLNEVVSYIISLGCSPDDFGENISENPCVNCPKKCWRLKENEPLSKEEVQQIKEMMEEEITMETADDLVSEAIKENYGDNSYYL